MKAYRICCMIIAILLFSTNANAQLSLQQLKGPNRPKIGLVLGGGGAKGAAEIGVLKALEEEGIEVDYIVGTSIGSIVGALYANGYSANDIQEMFLSQSWLSVFLDWNEVETLFSSSERDNKNKKKDEKDTRIAGLGLSSGDNVVDLLYTYLPNTENVDFDKMKIPFRCVAVDFNKMSVVVLDKGNLPLSIRASMSLPGIYKPVHIDGRVLLDGGLLNNLPVDVARNMGAEYVIAIDLSQEKQKSMGFSLQELFGIGGWLDWIFARPDVDMYDKNVKDTDLYINPRLEGCDVMDFTNKKIARMMELGYQAGKQAIAKIK